MKQHLFLRGMGALLVAGMGTMVSAQDDEENNNEQGERRVRIEITRNENGQRSHVTREFDLNDAQQLQDALKELGVIDELNMIGNGENLTIDLKRMREGGMLNDMSMALSLPDALEAPSAPQPYLGVYYGDWSASCDKAERKNGPPVKQGAVVTGIDDGTPAAKAGLKEDDVIIELGGAPVKDGESLVEAINAHEPGDKVNVVYYRGKEKRSTNVKLDERKTKPFDFNFDWDRDNSGIPDVPDSEDMDADAYANGNWSTSGSAFLGVIGEDLDDAGGVRVTEVVDSSSAQRMGLEEGDVIRSLNGTKVVSFGALAELVGSMQPDDEVSLQVTRNEKPMTLTGRLGKQKRARSWSWNGRTPFVMPPMPPMPPMPQGLSPEDQAEYQREMDEYQRDIDEHQRDMDEHQRDLDEFQRDRDEQRRDMDELRRELDELRRDLRGEVTREVRVTVDEVKLSKEETDKLKAKGVTNLDQPLDLQGMRCFPNPSEDSFHIQFQVPERGDLAVDVHDGNGERVYHETITGFKGNYERTLDMSDRADGTYFLVITQNGRTQARKLMKQ